ncbi:MAG: ATP-binding protein [Deltaproteobacteria bacterium]|jgi:signal transduction histidine kinase|nr:ATP-binding protein [Deltaproteobacteria bacterium]
MKNLAFNLFFLFLLLISFLPVTVFWTQKDHSSQQFHPIVWKSILKNLETETGDSRLASGKIRNKIDQHLKYFRTHNQITIIEHNNSSIILGSIKSKNIKSQFEQCIQKTTSQSFGHHKNWYCFHFKNSGLKAGFIPENKPDNVFPVYLWLFIFAGPIIVLSLWIMFFYRQRNLHQFANVMRQAAREKLELIPEKFNNRETRELYNSLAVMTATLREKNENLQANIQTISRQKENLEKSQKEILKREKLVTTGYLAAGIAHEIGNPVSGLTGLVELMQSTELSKEQQLENFAIMAEELQRIDKMIRKLLEFSRPAESQLSPMKLKQLVEHSIELSQHQKALKNIVFFNRINDENLFVLGTNNLIQLFVNLYINSGQATRGQGEITVETTSTSGSQVELLVKDNGPGIENENLKNIFEPFFTTKSPDAGTGLGLWVCRNLAEQSQGEIEYFHTNEGTAFKVILQKPPS